MRNRKNTLAVIASLLLVCHPAAAQDQAARPSATREYNAARPWIVDYAEDSCSLFRSFVDGEREVWFELRRIAPVGQARLSVGSSHLELTDRSPHISIFPAREPFDQEAETFVSQDGSVRAFVTMLSLDLLRSRPSQIPPNADEEPIDGLPQISGIQVASVFDETVVLHTGEMDAPLQAMDTCMADLVQTWGIEPEELRRSVSSPTPVLEDRWRARVRNHYPRTGLRRSRNTAFPVVLLVGPDGRVLRCRSPNALGDEDFEAVACAALVEYARFDPALDANGEPTYGFWFTNMI
ncbi:hypothetical protein [Erythrobacter alti]|uniref:hypothetical protein n=1 Tax=Erythrobacter alti TaxID=1896145 RepID=UPI0030F480B1